MFPGPSVVTPPRSISIEEGEEVLLEKEELLSLGLYDKTPGNPRLSVSYPLSFLPLWGLPFQTVGFFCTLGCRPVWWS